MPFRLTSRIAVLTLALSMAGFGAASTSATPPDPGDGDVIVRGADDPTVIPGEYIVVLRDRGKSASAKERRQNQDKVLKRLSDDRESRRAAGKSADDDQVLGQLTGDGPTILGKFSKSSIDFLGRQPEVAEIIANQTVTLAAPAMPTAVPSAVQSPTGSWGIDRIDQRNLPLDNTYRHGLDGTGVNVYVMDTGINYDHSEFTGRIGNGIDQIDGDTVASDCNGHGTHVASTAAGRTLGVATNATIHPIRIFACDGTTDLFKILNGITWLNANKQLPAVVNMSFAGSVLLNSFFQTVLDNGIVISAAAGNTGSDACAVSPAGVGGAITVGAINSADQADYYTNTGACVDLFAPGSKIVGAALTGPTSTITYSGTSMAAPHVAGVAALYLQRYPSSTVAQVHDALTGAATPGVVQFVPGLIPAGVLPGTPNRLLNIQSFDPTPATNNLALSSAGAVARQSSTGWSAPASRANDGNTDGNFSNASVSTTFQETNPWWEVNLGGRADLTGVQLFNRTDCCSERLSNFYILTSAFPTGDRTLSQLLADPSVQRTYVAGPVATGGVNFPVTGQAQYVRIQNAGDGFMTLAEVKVSGQNFVPLTNLSQGKPATQSSTAYDGVAQRGVDGNTDGNYYGSNSVTHTGYEATPWWQVDLGTTARVNNVRLFNRTDCCSDRLSNVYVLVSPTPFGSRSLPELLADMSIVRTKVVGPVPNGGYDVNVPGFGRYVRVQLEGTNILDMAEVQVMGSPLG